MPDPLPERVLTRAEILREIADARECLAKFQGINADRSAPFGFRYEAAIMIDVCNETLFDFEVMLRLLPEA